MADPERSWSHRLHVPTWIVSACIYAGWLVATAAHAQLPWWLLMPLGGLLTAWQGSLQHETIHGHPGGPAWARWLLGAIPLSLWLPYEIYRESHQQHHATAHLTDPADDPESPFRTVAEWSTLGRVARAFCLSQRTTLGRLVLGPPLGVVRFLRTELLHARGAGRARTWAVHAVLVTIVLAWLHFVAQLPLWQYVAMFVYPGASFTLLRSLAEHRTDADRTRRTTVVEAGWFFRLLFLNNNFHVMHHRAPHVPWFELREHWHREREQFVAAHPDLHHAGYLTLFARHAIVPISPAVLIEPP